MTLRKDGSKSPSREIFEADVKSNKVQPLNKEDSKGKLWKFLSPLVGDKVKVSWVEAKTEGTFIVAIEVSL